MSGKRSKIIRKETANSELKDSIAIYVRVSSDHQALKGHSLEAQIKLGIQKAESLSMNYEIFKEAGESAKYETLDNRPMLTNLVKRIESGEFKFIFFTELDRLSRNETTQVALKVLFHRYNVIAYTVQGSFNLNNFNDEFLMTLLNSLARRENKERVERSKRAMEIAAQKGQFGGGIPPWGFDIDKNNFLIVNEEEKKIYLKMVYWSLKQKGSRTIAMMLNEMGIQTKGAKCLKKGIHYKDKVTKELKFKPKETLLWKASVVLSILKNSIYCGKRKYLTYTIDCPKLIDEDTWNSVQENLSKNRISSPRNTKHFYLLKEMLVCAKCGRFLFGKIKPSRGERVYCCASKKPDPHPCFCGLKNVNIDKINNFVYREVINIMTSSSKLTRNLREYFSDVKESKEEILKENKFLLSGLQEINNQKTHLIQLHLKKIIEEKEANNTLIELRKLEADYQRRLNQNELRIHSASQKSDVYSWIFKLQEKRNELLECTDEIRKREILKSLVNKIIIDYSEKEKTHIVEIDIKIPVFEKGYSQLFFLEKAELNTIKKEQPAINSNTSLDTAGTYEFGNSFSASYKFKSKITKVI
jgi:site-specific DNA recombinase